MKKFYTADIFAKEYISSNKKENSCVYFLNQKGGIPPKKLGYSLDFVVDFIINNCPEDNNFKLVSRQKLHSNLNIERINSLVSKSNNSYTIKRPLSIDEMKYIMSNVISKYLSDKILQQS